MAMDVKRDPAILKRKQRNRLIGGVIAVAAVIGLTVAVSQLQPAAPTVAGSAVYTGTVKRGPMVREVRGAGTLVPEDIRWISTTATGKVEKLVLRAGAKVTPGTVILELSNPDIKQQVSDAELAWKAAVAQLENAKANQATSRMSQENAASDAQSAYLVAQSDLEANKILNGQGIVADQQIKVKQQTVDSAKNRLELAKKQLQMLLETEKSQLAPQEAAVSSARARYDQLSRQLSDLSVRSNMSGLLQAVPVEVGQQVGPGTNLARVSDPTRLKAEVRISETQTRDLAIGQLAKIDTRNGVIKGHVTRIDPASAGGTVGVDVTLDEALPLGARPDQSVDGVIELQRLENVLFVESPTFGQENSTVMLFKFTTPTEAERTAVKLGRRSVSFVEVVDGLKEGDRVILSDMQQYDGHQRLRIN
jgi:HlyD family secretion protein